MEQPLYETEDYQGVRDVLAVIRDPETIRLFMDTMAPRQVLLADGHHRYQGSLAYRRQMMSQNPQHTGHESYNYHLMFLSNTEADDLRIMPTHRLLLDFPLPMEDGDFLQNLETYFVVTPKEDAFELNEVIAGKQWAFGMYLSGKAYKLRLRPEVHLQLEWPLPDVVKNLDLTVLHYFVFQQILGISYEVQRTSPLLVYDRNFTSCITQVEAGKARAAFITNEVAMEQVKQVSQAGALMPQKSTFFYPKVICGFLFSSIKEDEFTR